MKQFSRLIICLGLIFFSLSCKKKNDDDCPLCPKIDALSPASGKKGDTVIITGSNFSNYLADNIVKFNGTVVPASDMISGGSTQLKVRVPAKCGTGPVTITLDDELYSEAGPVFNYIESATVSVFAGANSVTGGNSPGNTSFKDVRMTKPTQLAIDAANSIFVLDGGNKKIRKLDNLSQLDVVLSDNSTVEEPTAIAADENDFLYVSSFRATNNYCTVYRFTPGSLRPDHYVDDADANRKHRSITCEGNGQLYMGHSNVSFSALIPKIRHYSPTKGMEEFADSSGSVVAYKNSLLFQIRSLSIGSNKGSTFSFYSVKDKKETVLIKPAYGLNSPMGLAIDNNGNAYISDTYNNRILKCSPTGAITVVVSIGLSSPQGLVLDKQGNLYVADTDNNCIKKIIFN